MIPVIVAKWNNGCPLSQGNQSPSILYSRAALGDDNRSNYSVGGGVLVCSSL